MADKHSKILIIAAFCIPVFILVIVFAIQGIYPFGEQQIAVIDMYNQYIPFLGELQYKLQDGGSLFYTWNSGTGSNFWCLLSYYGASPLNLLLILFPQKFLMEGVTVILLIKVGLTGAFMFYYLKNVHRTSTELQPSVAILQSSSAAESKCGWHTVAFASMYALCSYVVGYYWCIMWLDAVMLLPLVILGLNRLIEDGRMALYTVSLAVVVFSNYYIAIMVCIFILIYYPLLYFIKTKAPKFKACIKTTARAVACSLIAIGMAAVMLLPTYVSMKNAYYFKSAFPNSVRLYEDILNLLNQILPNAHITYLDGVPNLSVGLLAAMMLVIYFIARGIPLKEKILNGVILLILLLSMNVNVLDFIWHGFHYPNQLPFRFSFLFCFLLVALGYKAFNMLSEINRNVIVRVIVVGFAYYIIVQKLLKYDLDDTNLFVYFGLCFLSVYGILLYLYSTGKLTRKHFQVAIVVAVSLELCITTCTEFDKIGNSSRTVYNENKSDITELAEYVNDESAKDGSFARAEIDSQILYNAPAFYHYRGVSQFSSTLNADTTALMRAIGLEGKPSSNRFKYVETNPVTNSLLNINYLFGKSSKISDTDFKYIKQVGNSKLYKSEYPLSIGYMSKNSIRNWNGSSENPFSNLNSYIKAVTGGEVTSVFVDKGSGTVSGSNVSAKYEADGWIETDMKDSTDNASVKIKYTADSNEKYYVYVEADYAESITIVKSDNKNDIDADPEYGAILNIGEMDEGETFSVKIKFETGKASNIRCHVCTLDYNKWNKAYSILSDNLLNVTESTDTYIKGEIDVKDDGVLVTSIPYEEGWQLTVDGDKKENIELVGDSWISLGLSKGKHTIELKFRPPGLYLGLGISILSILVLVVLCVIHKRKSSDSKGETSDSNSETSNGK